jgi:hypothetical protein
MLDICKGLLALWPVFRAGIFSLNENLSKKHCRRRLITQFLSSTLCLVSLAVFKMIKQNGHYACTSEHIWYKGYYLLEYNAV